MFLADSKDQLPRKPRSRTVIKISTSVNPADAECDTVPVVHVDLLDTFLTTENCNAFRTCRP